MSPNLNLNWLRTFEAASRHLSFTAASKELGMTQTAVSLQIKSLETKLGQDLFIRRAKSLQLTDIGKAYLPSVQDSLLALNMSTNGLFGPDQASTVIVRASMAMTVWLAPMLGDFQALYPNVGIKLVTAIWLDSIDTQQVDIDIVLAPDGRKNQQMEKLSDEFIVPVGGPNTSQNTVAASDLTKVHPIHILGYDDHWSRYLAAFNLQHDVRSTRLQADTTTAALEMVACDLGCAVVLERFAMNAIKTGRPIRCIGERVALNHSHYLIERETRDGVQPMAKAFAEWLRTVFHKQSG